MNRGFRTTDGTVLT